MSAPSAEPDILHGLRMRDVLKLKLAEDLRVTHGCLSGRYSGWITDPEGRALFSTPALFETSEMAEAHMRGVIKAAREFQTKDST